MTSATYKLSAYIFVLAEVKTFKDMNEVRSYVIREYKVPFEDACKDIDRWHGENDEWFRIK